MAIVFVPLLCTAAAKWNRNNKEAMRWQWTFVLYTLVQRAESLAAFCRTNVISSLASGIFAICTIFEVQCSIQHLTCEFCDRIV